MLIVVASHPALLKARRIVVPFFGAVALPVSVASVVGVVLVLADVVLVVAVLVSCCCFSSCSCGDALLLPMARR